ncbi:MAG TPA: hypothetical protein VHG72_05315 [Polyangia bacterium]|nr:hypothetical protein [Polyangia bacterium]
METHEAEAANGRGDGGKTIGDRVDQMNDSAHEAWSRTRGAVDDIKRAADIDGRVARHPYGSIAAAVGIGYVLGGGIFTPLTSRIVTLGVRIGVRLALLPMLREEISAIADAVTGEQQPSERKGRSRKSAKAESEL